MISDLWGCVFRGFEVSRMDYFRPTGTRHTNGTQTTLKYGSCFRVCFFGEGRQSREQTKQRPINFCSLSFFLFPLSFQNTFFRGERDFSEDCLSEKPSILAKYSLSNPLGYSQLAFFIQRAPSNFLSNCFRFTQQRFFL